MFNIDSDSKEWQEKRKIIFKRDNYTCQECKTFNPGLGVVEIIRSDDLSIELHEYISNPSRSTYRLISLKKGIDIEIDFGRNWLVLPVFQVHHKKYIENKSKWDYEDSDLITLCKSCHTSLHENYSIPIFDSEGNLIQEKKFIPEDKGWEHNHNIASWHFIKMNSDREYDITQVQPRVRCLLSEEQIKRQDIISKDVQFLVEDLFKRFFPNYTQ